MLDGTAVRNGEANVGNVENNNPAPVISSSDGLNTGNNAGQALVKKGGRKLRSTAQLHHQKPPRNNPVICLSDHNNNNLTASSASRPTAQPGTEQPVGTQTVPSPHHGKQGARKEMLKPKGGRLERGVVQPGGQTARDHSSQNVNTRSYKVKQSQSPSATHTPKKRDISSPNKSPCHHQPPLREQKKPLHTSNNMKILNSPLANTFPEYLKDGEKVYAGAKFSEPPSPSVLPKPPSHWVGENELQQSNQSREQMTVHLKSLLKVQDTS